MQRWTEEKSVGDWDCPEVYCFPEIVLPRYLSNGENVQHMEINNISKYRSDPTVKGGVIAIGVSAINMSSLQPFSKPPQYLSFITYWLFSITLG